MIHDDDTGPRTEYWISGAEPPTQGPPPDLPSAAIQGEIRALGKQPGVGADRIFALFRRTHPGVSREAIAYILQADGAGGTPTSGPRPGH